MTVKLITKESKYESSEKGQMEKLIKPIGLVCNKEYSPEGDGYVTWEFRVPEARRRDGLKFPICISCQDGEIHHLRKLYIKAPTALFEKGKQLAAAFDATYSKMDITLEEV